MSRLRWSVQVGEPDSQGGPPRSDAVSGSCGRCATSGKYRSGNGDWHGLRGGPSKGAKPAMVTTAEGIMNIEQGISNR